MNKHYKQIEFELGGDIESAIKKLSKYKGLGELAYGEFNGHKLYSDIDDINSAYKKITGKTKAEFDAEQKAENDKYEDEQQKHKEDIPELTKKWIEIGNQILDEKYHEFWAKVVPVRLGDLYHEFWAKVVPVRLGDLYHGMELKCCLDIVKELNAGCELDKAKEIINDQGHSGMSFSLVRSMVKAFCNRGNEFFDYLA